MSDATSDTAKAAEIVARLRNWQREMERSSDQLRTLPGGSLPGTELCEAADGSGAVAETLEDAADFIEAHMPSTDTQAAKVGERLPKISHSRVCAYVVSAGPAPCTCDFYDREEAAIAALASTPQPAVAEAALRVTFAQIIDPTAWKNEDGFMVEQVHSGDALAKADRILAALRQTANGQNEEGR